ncbi:transcriptional regulator, GntR family with aminotransferase domain-containing protein [Pseudodesulfovibrio mercurii]|uniref:Transcriptional regulator, GntR family with aminotransferase domain-containing protein n=1 Tax=Pseudodesulfovibrio mercurii TaxID=641491 RepID=F0JBE6_9BACT|nr:PLP-dependent aminotransferase family protein [Pseudodesulfovibrio mercurii]EGB14265.1 transcriptional regulator, GntR family with aminotransferase domain-containing protein [Pseudodesulfovibrio mercurii]
MDTYRYRTVEKNVMTMIDAGALALGDKLPSLRSLSVKLGVSVSTVNQAYLELERKGVIESRPRSGFFVRRESRRLPRTETAPTPMRQPRPVTRIGLIQTVLESVGAADRVALDVIAPGPQRMPLRELGRITAAMVRAEPERAMGYAPIPGDPKLIRQIAYRSMEFGIPAEPDDPLITAGCMEALYLSLRSICRRGDTVLIQSPTYYCFLQLLETLGLRTIEVPSDPERGVAPEELARALKTFDIAACVLAPNFNNPDSSLTPDEAKAEIVAMLAERDIPLVEDDVYTDLHFGPKRPGTYKQFDRKGLVLLCSSFSKTIAPGYRVGWMLPGRYRQKALEIKATTNVSSSAPAQMAIAEYLRQGRLERHLKRLRTDLERQMDTMQLHLGRHFPAGTRVTHPVGGAVLWLELPRSVDGAELFFQARAEGVGIAPGAIFSTQDKFANYIRLSCGCPWTDELEQGVRTLGRLAGSMCAS